MASGGLLTLLFLQPLNLLTKEPISKIYPVSLVANVNRLVEVGGKASEQSANQIEEHRIKIVEMMIKKWTILKRHGSMMSGCHELSELTTNTDKDE